jgi:hypothetical protein
MLLAGLSGVPRFAIRVGQEFRDGGPIQSLGQRRGFGRCLAFGEEFLRHRDDLFHRVLASPDADQKIPLGTRQSDLPSDRSSLHSFSSRSVCMAAFTS